VFGVISCVKRIFGFKILGVANIIASLLLQGFMHTHRCLVGILEEKSLESGDNAGMERSVLESIDKAG